MRAERTPTACDVRWLALLVVGAPFLGLAGAQAQTSPAMARAASVTGQVMLSNGNGSPAFALSPGYALNPGDRVDTRGGGRVVIDLTDGSVVIVQPETVLVIKDFQAAGSLRELFEITLGLVRVKINHFAGRPNPYRMNSPTASIAVRGTEFNIAVNALGETNVEVFEGAVEVSSLANPDNKALIESGNGVLVRPGQDFRFYNVVGGQDAARRGPGPMRDDRRGGMPGRPEPGRMEGGPPPRDMGERVEPDRGHGGIPPGNPSPPGNPPPGGPPGRDPAGRVKPASAENHPPPGEDFSPRGTASTYDRYIASLAEVGQVPFLYRFNAFPEIYLDSLENPAYATSFKSAQGRVFVLPAWGGARALQENAQAFGPGGTRPADHSISPQLSMFTPVGSRSVIGGNFTASYIGSEASSQFSSASFVAARRFGASGNNSFGIGLERLGGSGSLNNLTGPENLQADSGISQTRLTAGFAHDYADRHRLGVFFRYGLIRADDAESLHTFFGNPVGLNSTRSSGHSSELGFRLRGSITPKLFYGAAAGWLGLSLNDGLRRAAAVDSNQRDRLKRGTLALGFGYVLDPRTVISLDLAGGVSHIRAARTEDSTGSLLQDGVSRNRAVSFHAAIQRDLSRRLFASASILAMGRSSNAVVALYPDRLGNGVLLTSALFPLTPAGYFQGNRVSDFGLGWRFLPNFSMQYVYSTDYGYSSGTHALMLRYTFRVRGD